MAFNAHEYFVDAVIPPPPHHKSWNRVVWILSDSANMFILSNLLFSPRMFKCQVLSCNSIVAILLYSLLGLASFCAALP